MLSEPLTPSTRAKIEDPESTVEANPFGAAPKDLPHHDDAPASRTCSASGVELDVLDFAKPRDRKRFIDAEGIFYRNDPNYVAQLRMERMRFFDLKNNVAMTDIEAFPLIAVQGGRPVGRMTAHIDHGYNRYHETHAGWFGFFECIDDRAVAHAMLSAGCQWLREKGASTCIGPMNFNTNQTCGLLVENFTRPAMIETTYNPPYYEALLTSYGFKKAKDLLGFLIDVTRPLDNPKVQRIARLAERIKAKEGVTIRHGDKKRWHDEVALLFQIYNQSWVKNWGYVPIQEAEFKQLADSVKPIVKEELVLFVEVRGEPVGFAITLPDIHRILPRDGRLFPWGWLTLLRGMRKIQKGPVSAVRLTALGMLPAYRKRGLESLLFLDTALTCSRLGVKDGEISWTLEDNHLVNRAIESMDGKLDRRYRLLGLRL